MADYTTPVGKVRLLTSDLSDPPLLEDALIEGYLAMNGWDPTAPDESTDRMLWRAAADVLDAMATSEVLVAKKIRTQDLSTDGPAVAAELRKQAAALRGKADAADDADGSFFEVIPFGYVGKPEAAEWRLP